MMVRHKSALVCTMMQNNAEKNDALGYGSVVQGAKGASEEMREEVRNQKMSRTVLEERANKYKINDQLESGI